MNQILALTKKNYPIGTRVLVRGKHPHSGKSGVIENFEMTPFYDSPKPIVSFDDGLRGFVMKAVNLVKV